MTQDEILTMLHKVVAENQQYTTWTVSTPHLVALVNQAIEAEREACAQLCIDEVWASTINGTAVEAFNYASKECASRIRARG